jgi:hypothetical protein
VIVLDKPLASLRADAGDRFNGVRYLYPNKRPITRLRKLGEQGGRFYYAAADDLEASLPPDGPIVTGGKLSGRMIL